MFDTILIIGSIGFLILSFAMISLDLLSSKRDPKIDDIKKLTKRNGYSILFGLIGLILLTIVSFIYVPAVSPA